MTGIQSCYIHISFHQGMIGGPVNSELPSEASRACAACLTSRDVGAHWKGLPNGFKASDGLAFGVPGASMLSLAFEEKPSAVGTVTPTLNFSEVSRSRAAIACGASPEGSPRPSEVILSFKTSIRWFAGAGGISLRSTKSAVLDPPSS